MIFQSALIRNLIKLKGTAKLMAQGGRVCLKDSKYILFEILANRTWKGCTSSCRPSKPDLAIWLAWPADASTALPCPMCQDFKQNIFGMLEAYPFSLRSQFCCTFQLYQIPDQCTVKFQYLDTCSLCDSSRTGQTTLLKIIQLRGSCQNGILADPVEKISFENPFRLHSTNDYEPQ